MSRRRQYRSQENRSRRPALAGYGEQHVYQEKRGTRET